MLAGQLEIAVDDELLEAEVVPGPAAGSGASPRNAPAAGHRQRASNPCPNHRIPALRRRTEFIPPLVERNPIPFKP